MSKPTSVMLTGEQLAEIAKIIAGLNEAEATSTPARTGSGVPMLAARLPIEADGDLLGWAVDDIGGCYMFEAKVFP